MLQYHLRSFRRFLIALFLFSTLMILVNTTVFFGDTVFSSVASLNPNQTTDKTENTGINYKKTVVNNRKLRQLRFSPAKRFIRRPWPNTPDCSNFTIRRTMTNSLPPVALASFPGSGNTWVRGLIEAASGIYTGSIYKDANLYLHGFWGELADWNAGVTVAQKTHDSGADHVRSFSGGRSIFLNRNPYEAILSFHNFLYGGHVGHASSANFRRSEWPDFLMDQTRRWLSTAVNWTQYSTELLSIHYEDLRKDPRPQLRLILEFLQLPVDERRLDCIEKYPPKKFHRKNRLGEELDEKAIFPERMRHVLDRAIRYVDYLTQQTGNRGLPLDNYSYYNQSSWKGSQPARTVPNQTWIEWISDQWGFRVESLLKDPLTQMLRDEAEANIFYSWNIPFASAFNESKELERDFNSGPPLFIQQFRHAKFPPK
ncbi:WSC domain-containing protein 1-like [Daphnia pulicaria]|uniref:WSC domain-containing protein 1-like n=1 Tax=Daphnia pulicaria TaxID=35523 RepID=UPI001EEB0170|nr:WSC domain-containing protein 1-like [Daphnia pulicaria]